MKNDSMNLSKNEMMMVMHDQEQEIERLKAKVAELQATLDNYEIKINETGTLADASAQISNLFEAAQATVETYIENIKKRSEKSEEILADVQKQAAALPSEDAVHFDRRAFRVHLPPLLVVVNVTAFLAPRVHAMHCPLLPSGLHLRGFGKIQSS